MCGINGFNFEDKNLITLMNKTISYRGPDDNGTFIKDNISLGHLRLSIIDVSKNGHQPMNYKYKNEDYFIIYTGEIYNYVEIKLELEKLGHIFKSKSDSEVILAAYSLWGESCVDKFNGMWAFCIYNKKQQQLFLSRDRFGKKPLYYHLENGKFFFSSEIKALLKTKIKKEINKESLNEIFSYRFTFSNRTIFKDIFSLEPAYNLIFDLKKSEIISKKKYYDIEIKDYKKISFKDAKINVEKLLNESVKKRMRSDVPVATFLSGGLDSSLVTYYAKKYNSKLNTFSIGFDTTNELSYAKIVSSALKTKHHEFKINKNNILDYLDKMIYHMDEPIGADPGFLPIFVLSYEVSKNFKVVLSGDGADEIFIGYDRYKLFYYGKKLSSLVPFHFNNEILKKLKNMRGKSNFKSFMEITSVFDNKELKMLGLKSKLNNKMWKSINTIDQLKKAQIFDIKTLLPKDFFMKSDKMSSAFGLEQRTPFMDFNLVEFGLSLPIKYKLKGWTEKYILKEIAKDKLPKVIYKRRKHGFNVPIDYWFENVLAVKLRNLLNSNKHNLYNHEYIYNLLDEMKNSKGGFKSRNIVAQKLWTVLVFEMWYERFMK